MADDTIKGMLQEVQRSLDRSRRALESIEQRQQANAEPVARVPTLPASSTPVPGPSAERYEPVTTPAPSPSSISYTRRRTASYETEFLTPPSTPPAPPAPSSPGLSVAPPQPASSGEVASRATSSEWSSGERPSQRPDGPPSERPQSGRYTFVASRSRKKLEIFRLPLPRRLVPG